MMTPSTLGVLTEVEIPIMKCFRKITHHQCGYVSVRQTPQAMGLLQTMTATSLHMPPVPFLTWLT